jgi:hypothetical protein
MDMEGKPMTGRMDWRRCGLKSKEKISTKTEFDRMKWDRTARWLEKAKTRKPKFRHRSTKKFSDAPIQ